MTSAPPPPHLWNDTGALSRPGGPTLRMMRVGQHVIAILLVTVGAARAVADGAAIASALAAAIAVLAWYTAGVVTARRIGGGRGATWWLIGLALVWATAVAVSAEFVWLAFLIWLLAGHLLPLWQSVGFSLLVYAVVVFAPVAHHGATGYANIFGPLIGGVFALGISRGYLALLRDAREREQLVSSLTRAQQDMADLQEELAVTQRHSGVVAERTRLARDIHDTIAQGLSSIRLLAHAGVGRTDDSGAARTLSQVEALARDSLADVRRIVAALAPTQLEEAALPSALTRMLQHLRSETGIDTQLRVDDSIPPLATSIEVALLRTAQSALANVRLHADADRVVLSLIDGGDTVRLDVLDDGAGFDVDEWNTGSAAEGSGYGLAFMRARLRELGGGLDVESTIGEGTAVSAYLPLRTEPKEV